MYFSTDIFMSAGLTAETSQYATLGMGGMNVLMTVVSLAIIEKAGRKTLMLIGLVGMMFDVILLTACLALKVRNSSVKWVIDAGKESNLSLLQISCVINRMWQHGWHTSVSS